MDVIVESYVGTLLIILCFIILYRYSFRRGWKKSCAPTDWPVIGMLPALLQNAHRLHDFMTEVLEDAGGTFEFRGRCFSSLNMVLTSDPANVHHILSRNFSNYPKGPKFKEFFDILGDGIFNADSELWEIHRKITMSVMNQPNFQRLLETSVWEKVEKGLFPVLDEFAERGAQFDLQDIFQRFTFDSISKLMLDNDPGSLSIEYPEIPCEKAFNDVMEAILHRNILPESFWKLQRRLGIGKEKKMSRAWDAFDQFIYPCIARKEEAKKKQLSTNGDHDQLDCLSALMEAYKAKNMTSNDNKKLLPLVRDSLLNLMVAGRDTTSTALSWFFWLLSTRPWVETKILEEIRAQLINQDHQWRCFDAEESRKLVYLHAALCEALRLFPPVALEQKAPVKSDMFPCGVRVEPNTRLILAFYSMRRMESIWGKDCMEFRPERWIYYSERGSGIRHEPSYKFPAFNAGPRTCLGKDMAFIQMKMVAAAVIYNYRIQMVEAHPVAPKDSVILRMRYGFMVTLSRRN